MDEPKYSRRENERRFLVDLAKCPPLPDQFVLINDLYVENARLRLRKMVPSNGDRITYKFCKKYGALTRSSEPIVNIYLNQSEYDLLSVLPGHQIGKRRYHVVWHGFRFAIDKFAGVLAPLVLCEVDAPTVAELDAIPAPPWALREVTGDVRFTGGHLATFDSSALTTFLGDVGLVENRPPHHDA